LHAWATVAAASNNAASFETAFGKMVFGNIVKSARWMVTNVTRSWAAVQTHLLAAMGRRLLQASAAETGKPGLDAAGNIDGKYLSRVLLVRKGFDLCLSSLRTRHCIYAAGSCAFLVGGPPRGSFMGSRPRTPAWDLFVRKP
jgi:hypothetical protein